MKGDPIIVFVGDDSINHTAVIIRHIKLPSILFDSVVVEEREFDINKEDFPKLVVDEQVKKGFVESKKPFYEHLIRRKNKRK